MRRSHFNVASVPWSSVTVSSIDVLPRSEPLFVPMAQIEVAAVAAHGL